MYGPEFDSFSEEIHQTTQPLITGLIICILELTAVVQSSVQWSTSASCNQLNTSQLDTARSQLKSMHTFSDLTAQHYAHVDREFQAVSQH